VLDFNLFFFWSMRSLCKLLYALNLHTKAMNRLKFHNPGNLPEIQQTKSAS